MNKNILYGIGGTILIVLLTIVFVYLPNQVNNNQELGNNGAMDNTSVIPNEEETDSSAPVFKENTAFVPPTKYETCMANYKEISAECEALKNDDVSLCENFLNPSTKAWCQSKVSGDNSYCSNLPKSDPNYEHCYTDTAKTEEDCEAIEYGENLEEKFECLAKVKNDASVCKDAGDEDHKRTCKAVILEDASICDESEEFLQKWGCKIYLQYNEPGFCEDYHKQFCLEFYPPEE